MHDVSVGSVRCCFGSGVLPPNMLLALRGGGLHAPGRVEAGSALMWWGHGGTLGHCSPTL